MAIRTHKVGDFRKLVKEKQDKENQLNEIIRRCVKKVIYESFSSSLLRRIAAQHGGIWMAYTRGGNKQVPVSEITDDMFDTDKVVYPYGPAYERAVNHGVTFNDESALPFAGYDTEGGQKVVALAKSFEPTRSARDNAKYEDGARYYQPRSYKALRARDIRQAMQTGYNTEKDETNKYNTNDWAYNRDRHRDAKNMISNAKKASHHLKNHPDEYTHKYYQ